MTSASHDWILDLPLTGSRLIEASAGTGKTFTLTAWMLRLLLEADAALPDMLAVTFTRAATAELRERVRRRLRGAARLLDGTPPGDEESEQSARIIEQAQQCGRSPAQLRAQLQVALLQLDEASIFTIHGFCQRALHEFGFLAGDLNDDPLLDHPEELWQHVAADLWRRCSHADAEEFERLSALWKTPGALAGSLPKLCDVSRRLLPSAQTSAMAHWLHCLRADAIGAFEQALSARRHRTQDQLIEHAWRASAQPRFAAALHRRWHWLLIDEFQDTDPRQWDIFRRMHEAKIEHAAGLFLIGDPKQAIYRFRGGDLPTYLRAREYVIAREAPDAVHSLQINYRSRPSVLRAVETLFESSAEPFGDSRILFHRVHAARDDDGAFLLAGQSAPGLTLHRLASGGNDKFQRSGKHGQAAAAAVTAAEIARILEHGILRTRAGERRVQPSDIAVLVRKNDQINLVRQALTAAGVATASQSSGNVFESEAATDVRWLMRALAAPGSDRLYTALSTRLLGMDAAQIAALENDAARQAHWLDRFERAATTWQRRGPLPALLPFLTEVSSARLAERGGVRLLTDALHLLELLQAQASSQHGLHGLLHWFESHCERPPSSDEYRLRLDTDAQAVRVGTLHKSKGLEYPIVFLPFAVFSSGGHRSGLRFMQVHDGNWPA
ncbi:MAG: UvrD-helicase domain-containing protein, partial [Xanthomonadaceae bacterium]|nr:UvrD-helicase domain-containing protein [Xanthomonadaceae bacterium]